MIIKRLLILLFLIQPTLIQSQSILQYDQFINTSLLSKDQSQHLFTIYLKNSSPEAIKNNLSTLFPNIKFTNNNRTRSISYFCNKKNNQMIQKSIQSLDKNQPQIQMKISIIEVGQSLLNEHKNIFSNLSTNLDINYNLKDNCIQDGNILKSKLSMLINKGKAKIIANPSVITIENNKATIAIEDKIPYLTTVFYEKYTSHQLKHVKTGITLDIFPKIASDNMITAHINAQISTIKLWRVLSDSEYPIISDRNAQTVVQIPNNKTLIIAGLIQKKEKKNKTRIPFLSDLPILGSLFSAQTNEISRSDIIFLITPQILN